MHGMLTERKLGEPVWFYIAAFFLALLVIVFNRQILFLINRPDTPYMDWIMLSLTHLGNGVAAAMLVLLLAPVRRDLAVRAAVAMVAAGLLTELTKEFATTPRPPAVYGDLVHVLGPKLMRGSFPSGHTTTVFALACSLKGFTDARIYRGILFLAVLVGVSRIYIGAHFPVDVAFGALLGWLSALATRPLAGRLSEYMSGPGPLFEAGILVLAGLCGIYLAFFETMVRYNPWFLRPFGLAGTAAAVFMVTRNIPLKRRPV